MVDDLSKHWTHRRFIAFAPAGLVIQRAGRALAMQ
jgi:hypothetical protein